MPPPIRFRLSNGVPVLLDPDPRWKTVTVKVAAARPLDGGTTRTALLARMLERGCRRAPSLGAVVRTLESLYGASLEVDVLKLGECQLLQLTLQILGDRAVPRGTGNLARGLEFLRRNLCEPVLVDGAFPAEALEQEKDNLRRTIEAVVNDKAEFAAHRMIQEMCRDEAYRRYEYGEVGAIARIRGAELAGFHARLLRCAPLGIYVSGKFRPAAVRTTLERIFAFRRGATAPLPPTPVAAPPGQPRTVVEFAAEIEQAKLVLGFRTGVSLREGDVHAAIFLNGLLGGFAHSRLFRAFREQEGLAYSVHSWIEKSKGILAVEAGIETEQQAHAVEIVGRETADLARGQIGDEEMELTRQALLERVAALRDHPGQRLHFYLERSLSDSGETIEELAERIRGVAKAEVVAAAERLRLDTIYFLRPASAG